MGMCMPSGGVKSVVGVVGQNIGPIKDQPPNSRIDMYDEWGNLIQQRWFGPDGRAIRDRDWQHWGKNSHVFPHDHIWDWSKSLEHPGRSKPVDVDESFC